MVWFFARFFNQNRAISRDRARRELFEIYGVFELAINRGGPNRDTQRDDATQMQCEMGAIYAMQWTGRDRGGGARDAQKKKYQHENHRESNRNRQTETESNQTTRRNTHNKTHSLSTAAQHRQNLLRLRAFTVLDLVLTSYVRRYVTDTHEPNQVNLNLKCGTRRNVIPSI